MTARRVKGVENDLFFESFLVGHDFENFPKSLALKLWSTVRKNCYRLTFTDVLEFHHVSLSLFVADWQEKDLPIDNVYLLDSGVAVRYWSDKRLHFLANGEKIEKLTYMGISSAACFGNRNHENVYHKDMGLLIICRDFQLGVDSTYTGPGFEPHRIRSDDAS